MKLAFLTTETLHHAYFAREMAPLFIECLAILERGGVKPTFEVAHPFENTRDQFEAGEFFSGKFAKVTEFMESKAVEDIRSSDTAKIVREFSPDFVLVFGTRKLGTELLSIAQGCTFNLHGGNPEEYRGLDTHLWACYHKDFSGLVSCLHQVDAGLDTGSIVGISEIPLRRGMRLEHLRAENTKVCVELSTAAVRSFAKEGRVACRRQAKRGRYYSSMPTVLKEVALRNFEHHTSSL